MRVPTTAAVALGALLVVAAAQAVSTAAWREPVTAVYAALRGDPLAGSLAALMRSGPSPAERRTLSRIDGGRDRLAFLARSFAQRLEEGGAVGRLRIPSIGLSEIVGQGRGAGHLRRGPSHDPRSGLPGAGPAVVIAAHRTVFGGPFRELDALAPRDRVLLDTPYGSFDYEVEGTGDAGGGSRPAAGRVALVLATSDPPLIGGGRIVVTARLRAAKPRVDASTKRNGARLREGRPGR